MFVTITEDDGREMIINLNRIAAIQEAVDGNGKTYVGLYTLDGEFPDDPDDGVGMYACDYAHDFNYYKKLLSNG